MIANRDEYAATSIPCKSIDPDQADMLWFADPRTTRGRQREELAVDLCLDCELMLQCRSIARREAIPSGVWGGETERERTEWLLANGVRLKTEWVTFLREFTHLWTRRQSQPKAALALVPTEGVA